MLSLAAEFYELAELEGGLGRLQPFEWSRPEGVVEFEGNIWIRKGPGLDLEAARNADIALRRRQARIRGQHTLQSLGQRNRSWRPLSSSDWYCNNKPCARQAQSHSKQIHQLNQKSGKTATRLGRSQLRISGQMFGGWGIKPGMIF